jgi:hypothetical protein
MANKVTCTCGHSWDKSGSSKKDATVCHICGKNNDMKMQNGGWLNRYQPAPKYDTLPEVVIQAKTKPKGERDTNAAWSFMDPIVMNPKTDMVGMGVPNFKQFIETSGKIKAQQEQDLKSSMLESSRRAAQTTVSPVRSQSFFEKQEAEKTRRQRNKEIAASNPDKYKYDYDTGDLIIKELATPGEWSDASYVSDAPDFVKTVAQLTPSGRDYDAGAAGANFFVNTFPYLAPITSTGRVASQLVGNDEYGINTNEGFTLDNVLGGTMMGLDVATSAVGLNPGLKILAQPVVNDLIDAGINTVTGVSKLVDAVTPPSYPFGRSPVRGDAWMKFVAAPEVQNRFGFTRSEASDWLEDFITNKTGKTLSQIDDEIRKNPRASLRYSRLLHDELYKNTGGGRYNALNAKIDDVAIKIDDISNKFKTWGNYLGKTSPVQGTKDLFNKIDLAAGKAIGFKTGNIESIAEETNRLLSQGLGVKKGDVDVSVRLGNNFKGSNYHNLFIQVKDPNLGWVDLGYIDIRSNTVFSPATLSTKIKQLLGRPISKAANPKIEKGFTKEMDFPTQFNKNLIGRGSAYDYGDIAIGSEVHQALKKSIEKHDASLLSSKGHTSGTRTSGYRQADQSPSGEVRYLREYLNGRLQGVSDGSSNPGWEQRVKDFMQKSGKTKWTTNEVELLLDQDPTLAPTGIRFKYEDGGNVEASQGGYTDIPFNYNSAWGGQFQMGGNVYPVNYVPQAQKGKRVPVYVNDPNDPRLHSYLDSLNLYKAHQAQMKYNPPIRWEDSGINKYLSNAIKEEEVPSRKKDLEEMLLTNKSYGKDFNKKTKKEKGKLFKADTKKARHDSYKSKKELGKSYPHDIPLINAYEKLTFSSPTETGLWSTPDLWNQNIAPIGIYFGGGNDENSAWNPIFQQPVQPIEYQGEPSDYMIYRDSPTMHGTSHKFNPKQKLTGKPSVKKTETPKITTQQVVQQPTAQPTKTANPPYSVNVEGDSVFGPGNSLIGFMNKGKFTPYSHNALNKADKALLENQEELQKYVGQKFGKEYVTFAMGGSIPGSVGFTYARTKGIPSEGPYAKKTMPSAQEGKIVPIDPKTDPNYAQPISEAMKFTIDWMNSPMYKKMLEESTSERGYNVMDEQRRAAIEDGNINYYEQSTDPTTGAGTFISRKGKAEMYLNPDAKYPNWSDNIAHELSHVTDFGGRYIPLKDRRLMNKYATHNIKESPFYKEAKQRGEVRELKGFTNYVNIPTETRARINNLRKGMKEQGVYDPFTQSFSKGMFDKYKQMELDEEDKKEGRTIGMDPYQQLKMSYTDEEIEDMMNKISKSGNDEIVPIAQNGTSMSYYQNGLDWKPKGMKNGGKSSDTNYKFGKSKIQGVGTFAKNTIQPGEYVGKVHTINELGKDYDFTSLGRNHNHSEDPNVQNVLVGNERHLIAIKPISKGQELTSNYRLQQDLEQPEDFEKKNNKKKNGGGLKQYQTGGEVKNKLCYDTYGRVIPCVKVDEKKIKKKIEGKTLMIPNYKDEFKDHLPKFKTLPPILTEDFTKIKAYQDSLNIFNKSLKNLDKTYLPHDTNVQANIKYVKYIPYKNLSDDIMSYQKDYPTTEWYNRGTPKWQRFADLGTSPFKFDKPDDLTESYRKNTQKKEFFRDHKIKPIGFQVWDEDGFADDSQVLYASVYKKPMQPYVFGKPPEPKLKGKVAEVNKLPMGESSQQMGIRERQMPNISASNVEMSGPYMVGYTDFDTQQGIDRGFRSAEERDAFIEDLRKRPAGNYQPGQMNISSYYDVNKRKTKTVNKKETGGWLSQYK